MEKQKWWGQGSGLADLQEKIDTASCAAEYTSDCPGPRKKTTDGLHVTQWVGLVQLSGVSNHPNPKPKATGVQHSTPVIKEGAKLVGLRGLCSAPMSLDHVFYHCPFKGLLLFFLYTRWAVVAPTLIPQWAVLVNRGRAMGRDYRVLVQFLPAGQFHLVPSHQFGFGKHMGCPKNNCTPTQQLFGDNLLGLHMCRYVPQYINLPCTPHISFAEAPTQLSSPTAAQSRAHS